MTPVRSNSTHWSMAGLLAAVVVGGLVFTLPPAQAEEGIAIPAPKMDAEAGSVAVVAGGCFWGVQAVFQHLDGVRSAVSGYTGGSADTAQYHTVGSGRTGHAESVKITYDPSKISYGEILQVFFSVAHDPTQLNRQGPDTGTQYRSAIFPQNQQQAAIAKAYIDQLNAASTFRRKIVTTVEPGHRFYPAEAYHQDYLVLHPNKPYIVYNDLPKLDNLKRIFPGRYRSNPVLVNAAAHS